MRQIFLALVLAFILFGCTGPSSQPASSSNNDSILTFPLTISCPNSTAQVGTPFGTSLTASGGTGAYEFNVQGDLPVGLYASGQIITGTPSVDTQGEYQYTAVVRDGAGQTASSTCQMKVSQKIYACTVNGQILALRYNQNDCTLSCFGRPEYCSEYQPEETQSDPVGTLLKVIALLLAIIVAIVIIFQDQIRLAMGPETDERNRYHVPVFVNELGRFFNQREWVETDPLDGRHKSFMVTDSARPGDQFFFDSKKHYYGPDSNLKWNSNPTIYSFDKDLQDAYNDATQLRSENSALRERLKHSTQLDSLGLAKELSADFKFIGQNVHSVSMMPMRRDGQNFTGTSDAPPYPDPG